MPLSRFFWKIFLFIEAWSTLLAASHTISTEVGISKGMHISSYAICDPDGHSENLRIHARRSIKWGVNGVYKLLFRPGMSANLEAITQPHENLIAEHVFAGQ